MAREQAVYVYWDEHLKGHAFAYRKPHSNKVIVSDGVYEREVDAENSAWLCCFARKEELDEVGFVPKTTAKQFLCIKNLIFL